MCVRHMSDIVGWLRHGVRQHSVFGSSVYVSNTGQQAILCPTVWASRGLHMHGSEAMGWLRHGPCLSRV
jgi:hypothetical protein